MAISKSTREWLKKIKCEQNGAQVNCLPKSRELDKN